MNLHLDISISFKASNSLKVLSPSPLTLLFPIYHKHIRMEIADKLENGFKANKSESVTISFIWIGFDTRAIELIL